MKATTKHPDWKFIGDGTWLNETLDRRVSLNEDYRRTYRATCKARPGGWPDIFKGKNEREIRFRSLERAMRYAETH